MKKVNDLLERAIELSRTHLLIPEVTRRDQRLVNDAIDEKRKGDIASFGTALMQSGLLPAVALFSDTTTNSGKRRNQMLNVLFALIGGTPTSQDFEGNKKKLLANVLASDVPQRPGMRQDLMTACIALKLAVRTFHLVKVKENE